MRSKKAVKKKLEQMSKYKQKIKTQLANIEDGYEIMFYEKESARTQGIIDTLRWMQGKINLSQTGKVKETQKRKINLP